MGCAGSESLPTLPGDWPEVGTALKILAIVLLVSGGAAWARHAEHGRGFQIDRDDGREGGDRHEGRARGYGAPEPVTMVGLALGTGAAGLVAWRVRRKRS